MIHVLIADDHQIIRDGIKSLLKELKDIRIVAEAGSGLEVQEQVQLQPVDVVLMDINMPHSGIDTTRFLHEHYPGVKVLALTMHDEAEYISNILEAGASGYILKKTDKQELITAIRTIAEGGTYLSSEVSGILVKRMSQKPVRSPYETPLTKRETEILVLIANQYTNQKIAEKLFVSTRTVDTHRRNLLQKLGVKNTAGLVRYAMEKGLVSGSK
jgi:DNA-binding NarL/FixJ family response regulator